MADKELTEIGARQFNMLDRLVNNYEKTGNLPGFGPTESFIFDVKNTERNAFQSTAAALVNTVESALSPSVENRDPNTVSRRQAQSYRDQLLSINYVQAYEKLKGAGQITEYEGKIAAAAENALGDPNLDDSEMAEILRQVREPLLMAQRRSAAGVRVKPGSNEEFLINDDGSQTRVVTYLSPDGEFIVEPTNGRDVYVVPTNVLSQDGIRDTIRDMPNGRTYVVPEAPNEVFVKGQNDYTEVGQ